YTTAYYRMGADAEAGPKFRTFEDSSEIGMKPRLARALNHVIYVATPHNSHHEGVTLALNAGKHVLVEKPIALNRAQANEMVELARGKRLFFAEALWTFFLPKLDVLRQLLET